MNTIRFEQRPLVEESGEGGLHILIDGEDLIDLVRIHELPLAAAEGSPGIAGGYGGLAEWWAGRDRYAALLGQDDFIPGRSWVLGCSCGEPGCWPLECTIDVGESTVVWRDFSQPHRSTPEDGAVWDYSAFGPFEFDRAQYIEALSALRGPG
jgi:hypothetical protein